jgi:hypothetical protein
MINSTKTGEGSASADADPSSGTDFVRATFSHKGKREDADRFDNCGFFPLSALLVDEGNGIGDAGAGGAVAVGLVRAVRESE